MHSKDPIFICGEGRSGTKLLRDILGKCPDIQIFKCESSIFVRSPFHRIRYKTKVPKDVFVKSILASILSKNRTQAERAIKTRSFSPEVEKIFMAIQQQDLLETVPDTSLLAFDYLANFITFNSEHKKRWLEKTPYHINYIEDILEFYPDAKILVNYRDPRAVVASWFKKDKNKTLLGVISNWNNVTKRIIELKDNHNLQGQIHFVAYEDLIKNSEETIKSICNFLWISFHEDLLNVSVVNNKEEKGKEGFNIEAIDRWRKNLRRNQCILIDALTRKNRKLLGYEDAFKVSQLEKFLALVFVLPAEILVFTWKKLIKFFEWIT